MRSTGEIMIQGIDFEDASLKLHCSHYDLSGRSQNKILIITDKTSLELSLKIEADLKELGFEVHSDISSKENVTFIDTNFIANAIQDILKDTVKFVINFGEDKVDQAKMRKALLKTRTPELKTALDIKFLVENLRDTKVVPSLFSLQDKSSKSFKSDLLTEMTSLEKYKCKR